MEHLKCRTKSTLHFRGRSGQATDYSALCSRLDTRYRASASQWLAAQSATGGVSRFGGLRLQDMTTADATTLEAVGVAGGGDGKILWLPATARELPPGFYYFFAIPF